MQKPTEMPITSDLYHPRTGVLFPSRPRLVAITALIVITLVASLFMTLWRKPLSEQEQRQVVEDSLVTAERAAITGDTSTVSRLCSDRFLMNASGVSPAAAYKPNWSKVKVWFLKRQGKWNIGPSSHQDEYTMSQPTYRPIWVLDDPFSGHLFGAVFRKDGTVLFDVSLANLNNVTS